MCSFWKFGPANHCICPSQKFGQTSPWHVVSLRFFSGWAAVYDKAKLDQMYRLEHNEQMLKYSQHLGGTGPADLWHQTWLPSNLPTATRLAVWPKPRFMLGQKFRKDAKAGRRRRSCTVGADGL